MNERHEHKATMVYSETWRKPPVEGQGRKTFWYPVCGGSTGCGAIFMGGVWFTNPERLARYGVTPEMLAAE